MGVKKSELQTKLEQDAIKAEYDRIVQEKYARNLERFNAGRYKVSQEKDQASKDAHQFAQKLYERGDEGVRKHMQAVDTVASMIGDLSADMVLIHDLADAHRRYINKSLSIKLQPYNLSVPISNAISYMTTNLSNTMYWGAGYKNQYVLPDLKFFTSMDKDNKIDIHSLGQTVFRGDGKPFPESEDQAMRFKAAIEGWLASEGYEIEQKGRDIGKVFNKSSHVQLTKADFDSLRDDPVKGLGRCLEVNFGLNFQHAPKPEDEHGHQMSM